MKRPGVHVHENESRLALRTFLPSGWIIRDIVISVVVLAGILMIWCLIRNTKLNGGDRNE